MRGPFNRGRRLPKPVIRVASHGEVTSLSRSFAQARNTVAVQFDHAS